MGAGLAGHPGQVAVEPAMVDLELGLGLAWEEHPVKGATFKENNATLAIVQVHNID